MNQVPNSAATSAAATPDPPECTVLTDDAVPSAPLLPAQSAVDTSRSVAARAAMVARLEESGELGPGPVGDALLALPREALMSQAYVRRSAPDEAPSYWDLLDFCRPDDREEQLEPPCPASAPWWSGGRGRDVPPPRSVEDSGADVVTEGV